MNVSGAPVGDSAAAAVPAPVCFVHVPKTAGTTLKDLLIRAYPASANAGNWLNDPAGCDEKLARRNTPPVFIGHVPYATYRSHMPEQARYITLLREPVDRVVSYYFRHMDGMIVDGGVRLTSIAQALDLPQPHLANLATRFLCDDPSGELSADALAQAKRNLRDFVFVGLQERFDESVVLLQQALGLPDLVPYGQSIHVNEHRPSRDEISTADRHLILARNALDAELYEHGRALFAECAAAAGDMCTEIERLHELRAPLLVDHAARRGAVALWLDRALPPGTTRPLRALMAEAVAAGLDKGAVKLEVKGRRGQGTAIILVLDDETRFVTSDRRYLTASGKRLLFLDAEESRAIRAEVEQQGTGA